MNRSTKNSTFRPAAGLWIKLGLMLGMLVASAGTASAGTASAADPQPASETSVNSLIKNWPSALWGLFRQPADAEQPANDNAAGGKGARDPATEPPRPKPTPLNDPSLIDERLTQRYQDPRMLRMLPSLSAHSGQTLYREIAALIDARHFQPTSYDARTDRALENLIRAAENPAFLEANRLKPSAQQVQALQQALESLQSQPIKGSSDALKVMQWTFDAAGRHLGLGPAAVALEFVNGALDSLDQYSAFIPPEKTGGPSVGLEDHVVGIGVEVRPDDQGLKIMRPIEGGPAYDAQLKRGDIITAVDGVSLAGKSLNEAVDLILGPVGTPVRLELRRDNLIGKVTMYRRVIPIKTVNDVHMADDSVGYLRLDKFGESSDKELDEALWKLHKQGMKSLVMDLRGNPGGLLTQAIAISNRFLPSGTIVGTRGRTAADNSREQASFAQTWKVPLVVLIDEYSASASEIFAAAIQENGRGLVVGQTSYGKGTVQTHFPLQNANAGVKLTTAKFYSPNDREMAGSGVSPDVYVAPSDDLDANPELEMALELTRQPELQNLVTQTSKAARGLPG